MHGECVGIDPEVFFPTNEKNFEQVGQALVHCSGCPVLEQCREYALKYEDHGIWGGTTARQRRSLKRKAKQ